MRLITYVFGCILLLSGFSLKAQERNLFKKKTEIEVKSNSQLFQEKNKKKDVMQKWCQHMVIMRLKKPLLMQKQHFQSFINYIYHEKDNMVT